MSAEAWAIVGATFLGPVTAVIITLWHQSWAKKRDQQLIVLRMLSATRGLPGDFNHSAALTLVPVEFASKKDVMEKHSRYLEEIVQVDTDGNLKNPQEAVNKYHDLLQSMFVALGYSFDHNAVRNQGVLTKGFVDRDNLYLDSLRATINMAESMRASAVASVRIAQRVTEDPDQA